MNLQQYFRDIQDFPKEGILFKDITPLLLNPQRKNKNARYFGFGARG